MACGYSTTQILNGERQQSNVFGSSAMDQAPSKPVLEILQIGWERQEKRLWWDLNLQVWPGERVAVRGPSGCGKTQLLRTIARLDPLCSGELRLQGQRSDRWPSPAWRAAVLYVAQQTPLVEGNVETNLLWPLRFRVHRRHLANLHDLPDWLQQLGRDSTFLKQPAHHLSGGERQLLALLRALLLEPLCCCSMNRRHPSIQRAAQPRRSCCGLGCRPVRWRACSQATIQRRWSGWRAAVWI